MLTSGLRCFAFALLSFGTALPLTAQEPPLPPPDRAPTLVLAHGGPHAPVSALAFTPDGSTLYVAGFDKQVRKYHFDAAKDKFVSSGSIRVPIGPGNAGVVNALAVSPDGKWLAIAGRAPIRGESWAGADDGTGEEFRRLPALVRRDAGVVYLFDLTRPNNGKVLRGAQTGVGALVFADPAPADGPVLVTAGIEWNAEAKFSGTVRVFKVATGEELAAHDKFPPTAIPPGLVAWATGADKKGLRVAVNWPTGKAEAGELVVWDDPGRPGAKFEKLPEAAFNAPLAVRVKGGTVSEVVSAGYHLDKRNGGLIVRNGALAEPRHEALAALNGQVILPVAVAALDVKGIGASRAVLARTGLQVPGKPTEWQHELRFLAPGGAGQTVLLKGVADAPLPVLSASPDGRFVAVAGFKDNRVEVYDSAALAKGTAVPRILAGDASGFRKVAFLTGEKIWVGGAADTPKKGGVVLDLDRKARVAAPAKDVPEIDAPPAGAEPKFLAPEAPNKLPWRVAVAGVEKPISLSDGFRPTAAAVLPGKPAWDQALGAVVAVAQIHEQTKSVLVTLYDAATGRALIHLGGPTLPVESLVFSGSRALLAAAGGDGTVAVWSMRGVANKRAAIEGLFVTDRAGAVVVASIQPGSAAVGKLKDDDIIESVADAKGVQKAVKVPHDFVTTVRGLNPGADAQIKVKRLAAPVAVAVGTATGFRHPLFTLWVDPEAKDAKPDPANPAVNVKSHDWVGWTSSGPYDASGPAGEDRIGWLMATGDPARPVVFSGANQYRKLFYKRDFLRLLVETADYNEAFARIPAPIRPALAATFTGETELIDGRPVTRAKIDGLDVTLNDPDGVLDLDRAELLWQVVGPGGASAWAAESFAAGRLVLDLGQHDWRRGEHRVHVKLFKTGAPEPVTIAELTVAVGFRPPPPTLVVTIDGKVPGAGADAATDKEEIEVAATAGTNNNPDGAAVTLGRAGEKSVEFRRNPDGTFVPEKVKLRPGEAAALFVRATNRGEGVRPEVESRVVEVRVRRLAPKEVAPPSVKLAVLTPFDFRTATDEPYVVSAPKVTVSATATDDRALAVFEWRIGDGNWEAAAKFDAEKRVQRTRELTLPAGDKPLVVQVRAKSADSAFATDAITVRYDGLPDVTVAPPPGVVSGPVLKIGGGIKVTGKRNFKVRVSVTSSRTGRTREFDPTPVPNLPRWEAGITLFPGENQLGYVVSYDNGLKELRRTGLAEVLYLRPPLVTGTAPIDVGTGTAGDLRLVVLCPLDAPPTELRVNGIAVGFRAPAKPVVIAGAGLWVLEARSVPVNPGADRLKPVGVVVRNADRESEPVAFEVVGRVEEKVAPPEIRLSHARGLIAPGQQLPPVSERNFAFEIKVNSEQRLTRVELWQGTGTGPELERIDTVTAADAVAVPGGSEYAARPTLRLRPGPGNVVKVVASSAGGTSVTEYRVTYTPPPVWVVIDSVKEPKGETIPVVPGGPTLVVKDWVLEVEGRVMWHHDDEPIGRDRNLSVVFVANGVTHLPVTVQMARDIKDGKEVRARKFSGRVFLNTPNRVAGAPGTVRVRADLRSGNRPLSIAQAGAEPAGFTVTSQNPLRRQRLHVLVLGVEVPDAERKVLVQNLVRAIGGKIPADNPNFTEGRFERPDFEFAYLYSPRLGYTKAGDLNALLTAVRADIERRTKRQNEEWVNDVILVYYQGAGWVDPATRRPMLHSATTLSGAAGTNLADHAIRLDAVPRVPGMLVTLANIVGPEVPDSDLGTDVSYIWYAWKDAAAREKLLGPIASAVKETAEVNELKNHVARDVSALASPPKWVPRLADEVLARVFGTRGRP